jgi:hypothetical protein
VSATLEAPTPIRYSADHQAHQDTLDPNFAALVLQAIRQSYVPPERLALNVYVVRTDVGRPAATAAVFGEVEFSLTPLGALSGVALVQSSLSPALDQSLIRALYRADSTHVFPTAMGLRGEEPPHFFVSITSSNVPSGVSVRLFRLHTAVWHDATEPAADPRRPIPTPSYPSELLQQGFEGTLYIEFVIDELGRPVQPTFRLSYSKFDLTSPLSIGTDRVRLGEFVKAIAQSMRSARYIPGTVAGCSVKELVVQPYSFKIRPRQ